MQILALTSSLHALSVEVVPQSVQMPSLVVVAGLRYLPVGHVVVVTLAHAYAFVPVFHVDPRTQFLQKPSLVVVASVSPLPQVHEVVVTVAHAFAFVPVFHVDPRTQAVQKPSLVVVAGVRPLPVGHEVGPPCPVVGRGAVSRHRATSDREEVNTNMGTSAYAHWQTILAMQI